MNDSKKIQRQINILNDEMKEQDEIYQTALGAISVATARKNQAFARIQTLNIRKRFLEQQLQTQIQTNEKDQPSNN
jgi:hypothetical protein